MKSIIVQIPKELAHDMSKSYCEKFGVPYEGDPSFGHNVQWVGAINNKAIRAVIGYLQIPEGIYVFGYYKDDSPHGIRAFLELNKFTYSLDQPLWGHIREDNEKMWQRMLKEGWMIAGHKRGQLLVHWPNTKKMLQCQELVKSL